MEWAQKNWRENSGDSEYTLKELRSKGSKEIAQ